jgi:LuxR family maltose regulon positive regulatory protein
MTENDTTVSTREPHWLVSTRYQIPRQHAYSVPRPRLDALLTRCLSHKVLLVLAPAGYGKTTAVLQWVEKQTCAVGWLSIATRYDDLFSFTAYLVAAIRRAIPGACAQTEMLVLGGQTPGTVLHTTLIDELTRLAQPLVLVLEDYDRVAAAEVHQFMTALINDLPSNIHFIMTSRSFPPLPIARWRSYYQLVELRAADLCCKEDETRDLLFARLDVPPDEDVVKLVHAHTEGWMAGVWLAALSMQQTPPDQLLAAFQEGSVGNLREYLYGEVFAQQPVQVQEFLLRTSILDRFSVHLCAAVMANDVYPSFTVQASQEQIEYLLRKGLFVTVLDEEGCWYRYHYLFVEMLRSRLLHLYGEAEVAQLHQRAGKWFAAEGLVEEAVLHFLAGGAAALAARTVTEKIHHALNGENWPLMEHWLRLLPDTTVQTDPALLLAHAICVSFRFASDSIPSLLAQVESLLQQPENAVRPDFVALCGQLYAQRAVLAFFQNDYAAVLTHTEATLVRTPPSSRYITSIAIFYRALALQASGRGDEAEQWLYDLLHTNYPRCDTFTLRLQFALCTNCRMRGQVDRLRTMAERFLDDALQGTFRLSQGWANLFLGYTAYEANDLDTAELHFYSGQESIFTAHAVAVRECWIGLMLTRIAQGRMSDAAAVAGRLRQLLPVADPLMDAIAARLALAQGDLQTAERWATAFQLSASPLLYWQEQPALTAARILIATQKPTNLHRALDLLAIMADLAERYHTLWRRLECIALRAVALHLLGQQPGVELSFPAHRAHHAAHEQPALALVAELVQIAVPLGFRRLFLDQGDLLLAMVRQLAHDPKLLPFVQPLFLDNGLTTPHTPALSPLLPPHPYATMGLSLREYEILRLLTAGKTNREIAQSAWISANTVRNHLVNIYRKLGADNRHDAVTRALQLGLV